MKIATNPRFVKIQTLSQGSTVSDAILKYRVIYLASFVQQSFDVRIRNIHEDFHETW